MTLTLRDSAGVIKDVGAIQVIDADETPQAVASGWVRTAAGTLKQLFGAMSVTVSDSMVTGRANLSTTTDIVTDPVTAQVSGGIAPFTYLWEAIDLGGESWIISGSLSATATFTCEGVDPGDVLTATFKCTVTDSAGTTAETGTVTARAINLGGGL